MKKTNSISTAYPLRTMLLMLLFFVSGFAAQAQTATSDLLKAINQYPDSLSLHQEYIKEVNLPQEDLIRRYEVLMKKFPNSATIPFALGESLYHKELPEAKTYLEKAVQLNPKWAQAYFYLWIDGERWGDFEKSREFLRKAHELEPGNPNYAFYYANSFDETDPEKYKKLALAVAENFPESERGAQSLYWLAYNATDRQESKAYFEQLKKDFPPRKFGWSSSGMMGYFDLLLEDSPEEAVALAKFMLGEVEDDRSIQYWEDYLATGEKVLKAHDLLAENNPEEAVRVLNDVELSRWSGFKEPFLLLKSQALDKAGDTETAYEELKISFANEPDNSVKLVLQQYGEKLNKDWKDIMGEVWHIRDTLSEQATDFELKRYLKPGTASLSDYKGKVILLTYWFPGCGPCRGEFPHFQNVVDKFQGEDLVYLALNIVPEQNEYVIPFVNSSGYSFIPLEDVPDRDKGNLDNGNAAPVNFLIDREGRIVFSKFRIDGHNEEVLENMISSLLEREGSK